MCLGLWFLAVVDRRAQQKVMVELTMPLLVAGSRTGVRQGLPSQGMTSLTGSNHLGPGSQSSRCFTLRDNPLLPSEARIQSLLPNLISWPFHMNLQEMMFQVQTRRAQLPHSMHPGVKDLTSRVRVRGEVTVFTQVSEECSSSIARAVF